MRTLWIFAIGLGLTSLLADCRKVPLKFEPGAFALVSAHWYETEKVAYVFFELAESPLRFLGPRWSLTYDYLAPGGGSIRVADVTIAPELGVHEHNWGFCGKDVFCGSFSFKLERPLLGVQLRFQYDADSDMALYKEVAAKSHADDGTFNAYSALAYGVFDATNEHMQVRIQNNFGSPGDLDMPRYGLRRRFKAQGASIQDIPLDTVTTAATTVGTPLVFPANFCATTTGTAPRIFAGVSGWLPDRFDPATVGGVCFKTTFLDKGGNALLVVDKPAFGRRNPELRPPALILHTPLRPVIPIPVVAKVCPDDPFAAAMTDEEFLTYQRYVMQTPDRPTDVCFKQGEEAAFKEAFGKHLQQRLVTAKQTNPDGLDVLFSVLLHHRFGVDFTEVQSAVATELTTLIQSERGNVSPRLVGAFVYDANLSFTPTAEQRLFVQWCPQDPVRQITPQEFRLADQNCITIKAQQLDLKVINFVQPMGPLPSYEAYKDYVKKYGDKGLAKNPRLEWASVPIGTNTRSELNDTVTYFDNERFVIGAGQYARLCTNRIQGADELQRLSNFRFRTVDMDETFESYSLLNINALWLSDAAPGEYRIGIKWEYPFWGHIKYDGALNGKIATIVPYTRSSKQAEELGDPKWQTQSWDFGRLTQLCTRYCDNPYFDEGGTYQTNGSFRTNRNFACPTAVLPVWDGGTS